jgi:hypothetical protein
MAVGALAIVFGFGADAQLAGLEPETVVFPHVLLWVVKGVGALMVVQELSWGRKYNREPAFGAFQVAFLPLAAATIAYIFAVLFLDYYAATGVYLLSVAVILEKKLMPRLLTRILPVALVIPALLYLVFYQLLDVRMRSLLF